MLEISIVPHEIHKFIGATPDGFVIQNIGDNKKPKYLPKLLEIKCPSTRTINPFSANIFEIIPYHYMA